LLPFLLTAIAVFLRIISNPFGNVFQKQLTSKGNHPLLVNFTTYLLLSLVCVFIALFQNWHLPKEFWFFSVVGGIVGAVGNGFLVKALETGDLSILGPINSYKSIVGIIIGVFLLHEIPNPWGIAGVCLVIFGSFFVLDTTQERFSFALLKQRAIQYRVYAMILTGIEAVFIKKIILASSTTVAFISWCCFGALFSFLLMMVYGLKIKQEIRKIQVKDLRKYLFLIVCIGSMQYTTNYTFDHMPVGYALSLFQLSIIASVLLGQRVFKEQDIKKKLLGSVIMILGSVVIILLSS
jgi:drug/metabolite transporter (DMT)-like permease